MTLESSDITQLYGEHSRSVLRFLMRRTFDAQASVDLLAETFAVAYEQRDRFRGRREEQAGSWLHGIANNLLLEYFRNGKTERRALERLGVHPPDVSSEDFERIETLAETAELRAAVAQELRGLSASQRKALQLRVVDELSYPEVASRLDVTEQVARARVSRGLRRLRTRLESTTIEEVIDHA